MELNKEVVKVLKAFEKRLGYKFKNRKLLYKALCHKSYANELGLPATENNERLEFLGDAVLELSISDMLINLFPDKLEGELSKIRAAVVNEERLAILAKEVNLGDALYLGKGEDQTGGRFKPSIVSDAFEAVLGAAYLDRGYKKAAKVVERLWNNILSHVGDDDFLKDYKTKLQEVFQTRFRIIPHYRLVSQLGPDHDKVFEVELYLGDKKMGSGRGKSKKVAEQNAAEAVLNKLKEE